ncbi:MAG: NADH-quinone oxidoreductase subunit A [Planctomycetota bacterium]
MYLPSGFDAYTAIGFTIAMAIITAVAILVIAHAIGPKRRGPVKDSAYESGMPIVQDTHRRFNIRFYIVAMLFLLFDVEIVFIWPWALSFFDAATTGSTIPLEDGTVAGKGALLASMAFFIMLLLFGLLYEWRKGAFEWD